mgnify:CR=1 FL=1
MKKIIFIILTLFLGVMSINAEDNLTPKATSSILIEASTGKVLYEKDADKKLAPASLTKIMTMLLTMESLESRKINYNDKVLISKNAASMGGSQIFIEANSRVSVKDLIRGISIASANDAAVALAEKIGGTEANFINMMNNKAKELGLSNTTFKNPHGLDEDGHMTTARDLSIIAKELVKHEDILKFTSTYEEYMTKPNGEKFWLVNTNNLIRFYDGMDGLKTGYTPKAGYCLVGTANKNDMRLISVVMNEKEKEDRSSETIALMEYGYSLYGSDILINKNKKLGNIYISNSKNREYPFYLEEDVKLITKKGNEKVNYTYEIKLENKKAPLKKGEKVGTLILKTKEGTKNYNLIVKEEIKKAGYFRLLLNNFKDLVSGNVF